MLSTSVLKHPHAAAAAGRMTESLTPRQDLPTFSPSAICKRCYHLDHISCGSIPGIDWNLSSGDYESRMEFHWGCGLRYFGVVGLMQAPQFCVFPTVLQYRLLALMINQRCKHPSSAMRDLVATVKERICDDPWSAFLLHKLELEVNENLKSDFQNGGTCTPGVSEVYSISVVRTALSPAMVQKVVETVSFATGASQLQGDFNNNLNIHSLQLKCVGMEPVKFDNVVDLVKDQSLVEEVEVGEKEQEETTKYGPPRKLRRIEAGEDLNTTRLLTALSGKQAHEHKTQAHMFEATSVGLEADVKDMRDTWLAGQVVSQESFDSFMTLDSNQMERVLSQGDCRNLSESAVIAIIQNLVSSTTNLSYHSGITLLRVTTLPLDVAKQGWKLKCFRSIPLLIGLHQIVQQAVNGLVTGNSHITEKVMNSIGVFRTRRMMAAMVEEWWRILRGWQQLKPGSKQLEGLQQSASRSLLLALSSLVKKLPSISSEGLLLPIVKCKQFGAVHADILTKVIKGVMTTEQKESFWRDLIAIRYQEITDPFVWNESIVDVAQVLVDKVWLGSDSAADIVLTLQQSAIHLKQSSKFAKFLIELINRNSEVLSPMAPSLVALASMNKSMMKMSLMRTVKKLCV